MDNINQLESYSVESPDRVSNKTPPVSENSTEPQLISFKRNESVNSRLENTGKHLSVPTLFNVPDDPVIGSRKDQNGKSTVMNGVIGSDTHVTNSPSPPQSPVPRTSSRNIALSVGLTRKMSFHKVVINVSGRRFETYKTTLLNIPDTRLAWLAKADNGTCDSFDASTGEFFFDRSSKMFEAILNYYRTGKLHTPLDVCGPAFEAELAFWGIDEREIEPCCWKTYRQHRDANAILRRMGYQLDESDDDGAEINTAALFGIAEEGRNANENESPSTKIREKIWAIMTEPRISATAKSYAIVSFSMIILSIVLFSIESVSAFREPKDGNFTMSQIELMTPRDVRLHTQPSYILQIIDAVVTVFFTIEFICRLICCPSLLEFSKNWLNWIDFLAVLPLYLNILVKGTNTQTSILLDILYFLRLFRIFRVFKLTKHITGLKILGYTIRASARELILLLLFLLIFVIIFAALIYYAEQILEHEDNKFANIPLGFWWAVVTMTTLGYGDFHPQTLFGYIVGTCCAIAGVLVIAIPVPIIVQNFSLYYSHAKAVEKMPKKRRNWRLGITDELRQEEFRNSIHVEQRQSNAMKSSYPNKEELFIVNETSTNSPSPDLSESNIPQQPNSSEKWKRLKTVSSRLKNPKHRRNSIRPGTELQGTALPTLSNGLGAVHGTLSDIVAVKMRERRRPALNSISESPFSDTDDKQDDTSKDEIDRAETLHMG